MAALNDPQPKRTPSDARNLDPDAVARIVNAVWSVTRDRLDRQSRRRDDWSGYFIDHPDRIGRRP